MKKQVILMSLAIAGLLCCIPMFVLNAPGAPGLRRRGLPAGMAGAVLFGTCAGTLLQLKRLSRDPDYRQRQKAQCDERNQAIRGPGRLHRRILDRRTGGGLRPDFPEL